MDCSIRCCIFIFMSQVWPKWVCVFSSVCLGCSKLSVAFVCPRIKTKIHKPTNWLLHTHTHTHSNKLFSMVPKQSHHLPADRTPRPGDRCVLVLGTKSTRSDFPASPSGTCVWTWAAACSSSSLYFSRLEKGNMWVPPWKVTKTTPGI